MATIKKKMINGQAYYYLEHSYRKGGRVLKKEKYLGTALPGNVDEMKKQFIFELYSEKWFDFFEEIRKSYGRSQQHMPKEIRQKETETFAVRFTYDTNRIEGSKLSLRETANLLENGVSPKEKPVADIKEAESHRNVFFDMLDHEKGLNMQTVLQWHRKLFEKTKTGIAGRFRDYQVAISGSRFLPPSPVEIHPLVKEFFRWYEKNKRRMHPIEMAALVHLKFVTIHPFGDGNGRISRLMMNFILHKHGYPMFDIRYEKRTSYYNALERAQVKGNETIFLNWFFRQYVKEQKKYVRNS